MAPFQPLGMLFKTFSAAVFGIDAYLVEVEVDIGPSFQGYFSVVGLPDIAVKESRERIKSAVRNCGFDFPFSQIVTVNLAPADIRKEGSAFDLPMALGILGCQGTFFGKILDSYVFLGELSLDGSVRSVRGALSAALAARERGIQECGGAGSERARSSRGGRGESVRGEVASAGSGFDELAGIVSSDRSGYEADARGSQPVWGGPARRARTRCRQTRAGSFVRRQPQHSTDRATRRGQDDAGETDSYGAAADVARRSDRNHANSQCGGNCSKTSAD